MIAGVDQVPRTTLHTIIDRDCWQALSGIWASLNRTFDVFYLTFGMDKVWKRFKKDQCQRYTCSSPKSRNFADVCLVGGTKLAPTPSYKRLLIFTTLQSCIFAHLRHITFKLGKFTNFEVLFVLDFAQGPVQTLLRSCAESNWWIKYGTRAASVELLPNLTWAQHTARRVNQMSRQCRS